MFKHKLATGQTLNNKAVVEIVLAKTKETNVSDYQNVGFSTSYINYTISYTENLCFAFITPQ